MTEPLFFFPTHLDPESERPLYRQIYDLVRDAILDGRVTRGQRLASTRALAEELGVSRNTVLEAFDQLIAEGYLTSRVGAGTFVAEELPEELLAVTSAGQSREAGSSPAVSSRGEVFRRWSKTARTRADGAFAVGRPALDRFPWKTWSRLSRRVHREIAPERLDYGDPMGFRPLREALARYLGSVRGLDCTAEQIVVVRGSQQGLDLAARALLDEGDRAWIEDPGYLGARAALEGAGARLVAVPVDGEGLSVAEGRRLGRGARLAYVTPSHQYPLGVTLSLGRRFELLEWARRNDAWLIEDDYDSEYRFAGRPLAPLAALDGGRNVVYIGTLSKALFPALRIGYMVVPRGLVDLFAGLRYTSDRQAGFIEQALVTEFLTGGYFGRHVRRMRTLYRHRQEVLADALGERLPEVIELRLASTGLHAVGELARGWDDCEAAERADLAGVNVRPLSAYCLERRMPPALLFGFAGFPDRELVRGVDRLSGALGKAPSDRPSS
ncbi:MAG: PLP-dependent aminotransferase family protein [Thermoanaerobaculia bacterium]|nr:PLP-dependent aminotransferase family protein [Thermoanaerobaculia bacterium]